MAEDMSFGNWADFTPDNIRTYSEEKLYYAIKISQGTIYDTYARGELQRRQMVSLQEATITVHKEVALLSESSKLLHGLTSTLVEETTRVHREVALLTDSSEKLERLTATLKNLTWALIVLTILGFIIAGGVPIGIEIWKANHETISPPRP